MTTINGQDWKCDFCGRIAMTEREKKKWLAKSQPLPEYDAENPAESTADFWHVCDKCARKRIQKVFNDAAAEIPRFR